VRASIRIRVICVERLPLLNGKDLSSSTVLRLETNRSPGEAIGLYRRSGYVEVDAFNSEPYAHHWFEKTLT
jgi:hypothetical protein